MKLESRPKNEKTTEFVDICFGRNSYILIDLDTFVMKTWTIAVHRHFDTGLIWHGTHWEVEMIDNKQCN